MNYEEEMISSEHGSRPNPTGEGSAPFRFDTGTGGEIFGLLGPTMTRKDQHHLYAAEAESVEPTAVNLIISVHRREATSPPDMQAIDVKRMVKNAAG